MRYGRYSYSMVISSEPWRPRKTAARRERESATCALVSPCESSLKRPGGLCPGPWSHVRVTPKPALACNLIYTRRARIRTGAFGLTCRSIFAVEDSPPSRDRQRALPFRTCTGCGMPPPPTDTNYTLISSRFMVEECRAADGIRRCTTEWWCPKCWKALKETQKGPTRP